jgi:hypothetical protein
MKCRKCTSVLFKVQIIGCCDDCSENAAWSPGEQGHTLNLEDINRHGLERTHVEENGECEMGEAFGSGCYQFICSECGGRTHLPVREGC